MFDALKSKLKENTNNRRPEMWLYWTLTAEIEQLAPDDIFLPRMKGHIRRACRMAWASFVLGRKVGSFKQLNAGELYFIDQWFFGELGDYDTKETNQMMNQIILTDWWRENKGQIHALAKEIKEERKKK